MVEKVTEVELENCCLLSVHTPVTRVKKCKMSLSCFI